MNIETKLKTMMNMTECTHKEVRTYLTIVSHDIDGEPEYEIVDESYDTVKDVDLHRYKCTRCNKMFYYSERARLFFENGIENETYGLTTFNLIKFGGVIPKNYKTE